MDLVGLVLEAWRLVTTDLLYPFILSWILGFMFLIAAVANLRRRVSQTASRTPTPTPTQPRPPPFIPPVYKVVAKAPTPKEGQRPAETSHGEEVTEGG